MAVSSSGANDTPEVRLLSFLGKFGPEIQRLAGSVRTAVRRRLPTATELVYEHSDSVVIAYSPTDRSTVAIVATAARTDGVRLYFHQARRLPDPRKLLLGSGKQARFIRVEAASRSAHPDVDALFAAAVARAQVPMPSEGRGGLVIRSAAATRRPRRKSAR